MGLIDNPTLKVMEYALGFRIQRHDVIAANVANANTPGYRAFDLVLNQTLDGGQPLAPRRSDPRHLSQAAPEDASRASSVQSRAPARLDGNNVSLDDEFVKLMENRMMYAAAFELYDRFGALNGLARELG